MKFLITLSMLLSFQAFAKIESSFLTLQEFQSLSREQQAQYLKSVQKIMAVMTKQSLYMASKDDLNSARLPASPANSSIPADQSLAFEELIVAQTQKHLDKAYDDINKENAQGFQIGTPATVTNAIPVPVATPKATLAPGSPKPNSQLVTSPTPSQETAAPAKPISGGISMPVPNQTEVKEVKLPDLKAAQVKSKPQEIITETKEEQGRILSPEELQAKIRERQKPDSPAYRCMYSGWVLKKDPCKAQETFPEGYSIDVAGLDMEKMNCKGKTMCNPTLFGLKIPDQCKSLRDCASEAKPICVSKGAWPTEACYNESSFKDATVAAEINDDLNPLQYANFVEDFANLCSNEKIQKNPFAEMRNGEKRKVPAEVIRRDIKLTCGWAVKKMTSVNAAMKIDGAEGRRTWAADKDKTGPKKSKPSQGAQK